MQNIYLAKPGGQKEGPYTLEQIYRDLAARKYSDADFWAWYEGLPEWMPLHSLLGVLSKAGPAAAPEAKPEPIAHEVRPVPTSAKVEAEATPPKIKPEPVTPAPEAKPAALKMAAATEPAAKAAVEAPKVPAATSPVAESRRETPKPAAAFAAPSMSSGKPFSALEQIFVFTTGEGPSAFKSEITTAMLVEAVGEKLENIRSRVPVDVIGGTDANVLEAIRAGSLPDSAWRALFKIKLAVAQQAKDGLYHLCVRTFPVESKALVALILLYNKQKL